ncbi:MAG TPA: hypothetical protein DCE78_01770 [Bacteroidetes bacterium]|nr:hypothetical protein [Bacteroidota bacterium]
MKNLFKPSMILILVLIVSGCTPSPQPINFGSDLCEHCRMMVTDAQFGSQIVNKQSKSFKFDSVECMVAFDLKNTDPENVHSRWVPDFSNPDVWVEAEKAFYLHSDQLRSPMGMFLSAYETEEAARVLQADYGGQIISYDEVLKLVKTEWIDAKKETSDMMQKGKSFDNKH